MHILLTNDDGILAPGLAAVHEAVKDLGRISVVAPASAQSAAGHSITLTSPVICRDVHVHGRFAGISVDGSPADCVKLAVLELLDTRPDLVLSGLNVGANVGVDVMYSGTVAAAAEGALFGIPAVAMSQMTGREIDFERSGSLARDVLGRILEMEPLPGCVINVNLPQLGSSRPKGVKVVPQSTSTPLDTYHRRRDPRGRTYFWIDRPERIETQTDGTDLDALLDGYITITPLHFDLTEKTLLTKLASLEDPPD